MEKRIFAKELYIRAVSFLPPTSYLILVVGEHIAPAPIRLVDIRQTHRAAQTVKTNVKTRQIN